eukprot:gb/GFBE01078352.1/.p1 GENE.gb/GFBE01078352.1/~~gb/GFBE01078352.1/.p1  ORF type:complete len:194 (+),score=50.89 gb/GFBE01078352.1/:1-582(+)
MQFSTSRTQVDIVLLAQQDEASLAKGLKTLDQVLCSGWEVPAVYVWIFGNNRCDATDTPEDMEVEVTGFVRRVLTLRQPVFGMVVGSIGPAFISIAEACDFVYSNVPSPGLRTDCLLDLDSLGSISQERKFDNLGEEMLKAIKKELIMGKLVKWFPGLKKTPGEGSRGVEKQPYEAGRAQDMSLLELGCSISV